MSEPARPLHAIAREITGDWGSRVNYAAVPYLDAMRYLSTMDDTFGHDQAEDVVIRFLLNARSWRGPVAQRVKAELRAMLDERHEARHARTPWGDRR